MTLEPKLSALDLSALLASRICHDIISPVGALNNGLEVLEEGADDEMKAFAMDLITKSARQASAKLQFSRIAFGAAGSQGSEIDISEACSLAHAFFNGEKADLQWETAKFYMPKNKVKLILNLLMIATHFIPRGGVIKVDVDGTDTPLSIRIEAEGTSPRIPDHISTILTGEYDKPVDAHAVQPYFTRLLASESDMAIMLEKTETSVVVNAKTLSAAADQTIDLTMGNNEEPESNQAEVPAKRETSLTSAGL